MGLRYATLKKWLIAFTASAVLVGCGGGNGIGGGTSGGGGGGGGGGRGLPTPILSPVAQAQILILSGQGRRAVNSQIAVIDNLRVFNSPTDYQPEDLQNSGSPLRVQLDGFTLNQFVFDIPLAVGGPSKSFTKFPLEISSIDEIDNGNVSTVYSGPPVLFSPFFDLNMQLFPGRQTTVQVVLNDQMLQFDPNSGVVFDRAQFEAENYAPFNGKINAFLSDMVAFDVSALGAADRPLMTNGNRGTMVHFSGDSIGISSGYDVEGSFEMLNPVVIDQGVLKRPEVLGGRPAPGTYSVMEPDPRDPFGNSKLVAIQGIYRPYTELLGNLSEFGAVALPTTRSATTNQIVLFNRNAGGTITAMWQGVVDYSKGTKGVIRLFSLDQLPDASATPRASGTISFTKSNGIVKEGTFSITTAPTNFPFPKTGGFVVLR